MKIRGNTVVTPVPKPDPDVVFAYFYGEGVDAFDFDYNALLQAFREGKIVAVDFLFKPGTGSGTQRYFCVLEDLENDRLVFTSQGSDAIYTLYLNKDGTCKSGEIRSGSVELDTTLSVSGKAADAKAVGDKITAASAKKVDKFVGTGKTQLYGVNTNGEQQMYTCATGVYVSTVALRGIGGTIEVGTPTKNAHAATKKYVDDFARGLTKKLTYAPSAGDAGDFVGQIWVHHSAADGTTLGVYMYTGENHEGDQWIKIY